MTSSDQQVDQDHYRTSTSIRDETFPRRVRGLDADQVYAYLDLLADQLESLEKLLARTQADNQRLHDEYVRMRAALDEYELVGDRVNEQVVQLFSQAQLVAEEMVEDVSRDARERIGQARAHERRIVESAMDAAGQEVASYARAAQAQMQSIMQSFATDVERLGAPSHTGQPEPPAPRRPDPLLDDLDEWQARVRDANTSRLPGTD